MAKRLLGIIFTSLIALGYASTPNYSEFIEKYSAHLGPVGSYKTGEIEIVTDAEKIAAIQAQVKERLIKQGHSPENASNWSQVGIVAEDNYWVWVRDAVIFPSGNEGTYDRIMWRSTLDGPQGVAILPVCKDGRIGIVVKYRHATRSWEIEAPSGTPLEKEASIDTAIRKCCEETGFELATVEKIGELAPFAGMATSIIAVYKGSIVISKLNNPGQTKAIHKIILLKREELLEGFEKGYINVSIHGHTTKAACRDSALAYALLRTST